MPVYRYEDASGRGPYTACPTMELGFALEPHYRSAEHPGPQQDGIDLNKVPWDWRCGFLYMEDLRRWFAGLHDVLTDAGFTIQTYMVPEDCIWVGNRQVVFVRP